MNKKKLKYIKNIIICRKNKLLSNFLPNVSMKYWVADIIEAIQNASNIFTTNTINCNCISSDSICFPPFSDFLKIRLTVP